MRGPFGPRLLFQGMAMNVRLISALLLGLAGVSPLCGLGVRPAKRMYKKAAQLDEMPAGISVPAVPVPRLLDPEKDRYRPVTAEGRFTGQHLYVLSGKPMVGAGGQGCRWCRCWKPPTGGGCWSIAASLRMMTSTSC